jgi:hypothetical protein
MEITLKEYKEPVKVYYYPGDTLFIYFQYNLVDPPQIKKNNHIILIDRHKRFFMAGIDGYFRNFRDTLNWLKSQIKKLAPRKVVVVGCSSGGFAAILFGNLLGVSAVYAFGATTCLDSKKLESWGDARYADQRASLLIEAVERSNSIILGYLDLRNLDYSGETRYALFYSDKIAVDKHHAENMPSSSNILKKAVSTHSEHHIANIKSLLPKIIAKF